MTQLKKSILSQKVMLHRACPRLRGRPPQAEAWCGASDIKTDFFNKIIKVTRKLHIILEYCI